MVFANMFGLIDPFLFNIAVIIFSLIILFYSADLIVLGISNYAKKLGLSDYIVGLFVVAAAASTPEVIASLVGLTIQEEGVFFGTILGSNMIHMALLTGILVLIGKNVNLGSKILEKSLVFLWIILMLPFVLILDGTLSRADGLILLAAFGFYLIILWRKEGKLGKLKKNVKLKTLWRDMFIFVGSLVALLLAGRWLVFSSVQVATLLSIPSYFVALTVISIGTTIPDLTVELRSMFRGHTAIGVGDALGSLVIELLLFFGIVALIKPITTNLMSIANAGIFLILSITLLLYFIHIKKVTRRHGVIMLSLYAAFLAIEIFGTFA